MRFPPEHPFNPLPLLRLAIACDSSAAAVHAIFRFVWRDGRLPDLPIEWAELAEMLGIADADARIASPEVKDELRATPTSDCAGGVRRADACHRQRAFLGCRCDPMAIDYIASGLAVPRSGICPRRRAAGGRRAQRRRETGQEVLTTPAATSVAIIASSQPASRRISALCSPCRGASRCLSNAYRDS
jgi:hypothetical protein